MSDKKITMVDTTSYASPARYTPGSGNSRRIEAIRYYFGLIYTIGANGALTYRPNDYGNEPLSISQRRYQGGVNQLRVDISEPFSFGLTRQLSPLETREDISVRPSDNAVGRMTALDRFDRGYLIDDLLQRLGQSGIGDLQAGTVYYDHHFEAPMPTSIQNPSESPRALYYNVAPEYSYHSKNYEEAIGKPNAGASSVYEAYLPNLYSFILEAKSSFRDAHDGEATGGSLFGRLISLEGEIPDVFVDEIRREDDKKIADRDEGQYFKKYAATIQRINMHGRESNNASGWNAEQLRDGTIIRPGVFNPDNWGDDWDAANNRFVPGLSAYKTTLFPTKMAATMKEVYDKRNLFPMHNLIEFRANTNTQLVNFLSEVDVNDLILAKTFAHAQSAQMTSVESIQTGFVDDAVLKFDTEHGTKVIGDVLYHDFNIDNLKDEYFSVKFDTPQEGIDAGTGFWTEEAAAAVFKGVYYSELGRKALDDAVEDPLSKAILGAITTSKIKQTYKSHRRSYAEILEGKPAYREVMGYKIKKYLMTGDAAADNELSTLVTTIIIPNAPDMDVMRYIDTQVKYDTGYRYDVEQLVLVFGSKMEYVRDLRQGFDNVGVWQVAEANDINPPLWEGRASVIVSPSLRIYEVPYFSKTVRVTDDPPAPPELMFIPYKGVDNKILINVNNSFGEYIADAISFNDEQEKQYLAKSAAQNLIPPLVRFAGDDTAEDFILYRTRTRPRNYLSFANSELVTLSTSIRGLKGDASSHIDSILPNVKYYYTARTVDVHGNLSNPTSVFEVEMVSEGDIIYPIIRDYEFADYTPRVPARPLKKFLQIKPAHIQTIQGGVLIKEGKEQIRKSLKDFASTNDFANGEATLTLGAAQEGLWNRSFKLRLTSKQTGRKIDLNMTFRLLNDQ